MRRRLTSVLLGLALVLLAPASSRAADPKIPFEWYALPNGLEVILAHDSSVPLVAVDLWYHVGSGDEQPGKSGFAHLFEHMMFQGTAHTGEDVHFSTLQKIGASMINGSTSTDRTNYFEVVPSHEIETALWLESERMGYLLPQITQVSFDGQVGVVRNERRQNYDTVAYGKERFAVNAALYPEGHPYRYLTIGRHEDLAGASVDDVRAFFKKWYAPANATLVIAGDFDPATVKGLVEKWFGNFPKTAKPARTAIEPQAITEARRVEVPDEFAALRRVHYAWHSPRFYAPGDAELDLTASALGQPGTGRLYRILVVEKQLARNVMVYQYSQQLSGSFHIVVDLNPGADLAEVEKIVDAEVERVRSEPITRREFDRAVTGYESGFIWGLESLLSRAEILQSYNHYTGNPDYITEDLDRYRKSSPDKVQGMAKKYLARTSRVEVITMPAEKKAEVK